MIHPWEDYDVSPTWRIILQRWSITIPCILMPWTCLCMRIFLVKTMKRVPFSEVRSFDSSRHQYHYLLLFIALAQFPLFIWLGNITLNWLF
ncbi:putative Yif1 family protein [Helianthus annuus]|uniref:Yif1 family protein n=1 Tax=Helianthus annuus TaxID=4232 RepID=A0A9K3ICS2_HELAN|nr:putative Yif1 family protein [Helianthus annuus]KAJ0552752.1 putative Yif1 family protein [Helianthus annuus]KAJ0721678.1 putative Yif1 family protein [Helianthus annuus]KAJ0896921.1 putative Yif1 family protein [Helianthus annuus]KAJ0900797.1 putative Yif1 family protein [Helianthus annuus]